MTLHRRFAPGALVVLALLFASSGALRLGSDLGAALAAISDEPAEDLPAEPASCAAPPAALAAALKARDEEVTAREAMIEERFAALELAQAAIDKRMGELAAAEEGLKKTISLADGAAEQDLGTLTSVYEAMKPADAARLFAAMAPEYAACRRRRHYGGDDARTGLFDFGSDRWAQCLGPQRVICGLLRRGCDTDHRRHMLHRG
jgi:flagellar motility protein MotE (MotC chaperone)